jgi:hypothetical protein
MRKWWIRIFILPNLRSAAVYLRFKDANSTGTDDKAADAIDAAVDLLEKWIDEPDEGGPLPV